MKFLLPLLLSVLSTNTAAIPVKWTSVDSCPGFTAVVCGSFYFDAETDQYSFIDLTFDGEFSGQFSNFSSGNQHYLTMINPVPPVHFVRLSLGGFDLSNPVQQRFDWVYDFRSIIHFEGSSELVPSFEPLPNPAPTPGTFLLVTLAVTFLRLGRFVPTSVTGTTSGLRR